MTTPNNEGFEDNFSPFLPTTYTIPESDTIKTFLNSTFANFADVINAKKIGTYTPFEQFNGETWFWITPQKQRNAFSSIIYIPSLITGNTTYPLPYTSVDPNFVMVRIWGTATLPCTSTGQGNGDYVSFMNSGWTGSGGKSVSFTVSDLNLVVTAANMSSYKAVFVFEYVREGT